LSLAGKKMVGTRGGSEVPLVDEARRLANIAENERKVRALVELKRNEALGGNKNPTEKAASPQPSKKRKKVLYFSLFTFNVLLIVHKHCVPSFTQYVFFPSQITAHLKLQMEGVICVLSQG
jgi:hypothetical protein